MKKTEEKNAENHIGNDCFFESKNDVELLQRCTNGRQLNTKDKQNDQIPVIIPSQLHDTGDTGLGYQQHSQIHEQQCAPPQFAAQQSHRQLGQTVRSPTKTYQSQFHVNKIKLNINTAQHRTRQLTGQKDG